MTTQQTRPSTSFHDDSLGRVAGACAMVGIGLVVASLFPNPVTSPMILAKCAYQAGRMMARS